MSARPKTPTHADEKHADPVRPPYPGEQLRRPGPAAQTPRRRPARPAPHRDPRRHLHLLRRLRPEVPPCSASTCAWDRSRTHGKGKERHFAGTITVDERRCVSCNHCMETCKFDALIPTQFLHGAPAPGAGARHGSRRSSPAATACAAAAARASSSTRCSARSRATTSSPAPPAASRSASTTRYPYTAWKGSYIHTNFENAAATLSGVETAFRALYRKGKLEDKVKFIAFGGDGGTYDIGLQALSGAMERGHQMLYVCYDNGSYMNTGFQRSSATPQGAWTTTSPVGTEIPGQASATARTSPRSWWRTACRTWRSPRRTTRKT